MGIRFQILEGATKLLKHSIELVSGRMAPQVFEYMIGCLTPILEVPTNYGCLKFFCPGPIPRWRAETIFSKEPETIEWINNFDVSDIVWDIGANVGVYSLYAARRGLRVLAFEPNPGNYYILSKNIELNKLDQRIDALCVALNDETLLDSFYMKNMSLGDAENSFGEATDWRGCSFEPVFRQSMIGFSIDDFISTFGLSTPNHIKIDVPDFDTFFRAIGLRYRNG